mgnify:CR=1 FL=1
MCCVRVAMHPPQWAEARLETRPTPRPTDVPHRSVGSRHASQSPAEVWLHRTRLCCLCIACTSLTRRIDRLAFADDEPPPTTTPPSPLPSPPSSPLQRPASPMELIGYVHVKSVAWWRPVKKKAVLSAPAGVAAVPQPCPQRKRCAAARHLQGQAEALPETRNVRRAPAG